jgi:hypothetical protein
MESTKLDEVPALLAIVDLEPLDRAFDEFKSGKPKIYFGTNSNDVAKALRFPTGTNVYFKVSKVSNTVIAQAKLIEITKKTPL